MPSQYIFSHGSNIDFSASVRAYRTVMKANAEEGSVAISTVIVDDPSGTFDITGGIPFTWNETSESSNSTIIQHGYVADRDISRGPFRIANSRQWSVNISDINSILNRRIVLTGSGDRPAETDVARLQWVIANTGLGTYVTDTTYLSTASPVSMDANDYRNQRVLDVIDDCAQASGKNYFLLINESTAPKPTGIFYDFNNSTAYASTVRLTNVLADVNSTTTFAVYNDDLKLNRDPSRVYSQVIVPFVGGQAAAGSDAIAAAFFPRDVIAPQVNVHSAAKALARAARYIADASTEEDRLTMSYLVPLARVNRLREGHTYQVKFSHLPGYQDWTWVRALNRTVEAISEEFYKVTLEASPGAGSPASCSTALSNIVTWDGGEHFSVDATPPVSFTPSLSPTVPSLVFGFWCGINQGEPMARGDQTASVSGFTEWGDSRSPSSGTDFASLALAGYKAVTSGSPGAMTSSWTGSSGTGANSWRAMAIAVPTSTAAPVHTGWQNGSGNTITLNGTPTAGNMFVLCMFTEQGSGFSGTPAGYTILTSGLVHSGVDNGYLAICVRCVGAGETATQVVGDNSFSHWQFLAEIAIT